MYSMITLGCIIWTKTVQKSRRVRQMEVAYHILRHFSVQKQRGALYAVIQEENS